MQLTVDIDFDIHSLTDSEYCKIPVISQGILKKMEYDPEILIKREQNKKTKYLEKGSVFDLIILSHQNFKDVDDVINKLSDLIIVAPDDVQTVDYSTKGYLVLDYIIQNNLLFENDADLILAANAIDYYGNYTEAKRLETIRKSSDLFSFMKEAYSKIVTTKEDIQLALDAKSKYFEFIKDRFRYSKESSHIFQLQLLESLLVDSEVLHGKGKLDHVIIDEANMRIIVIDLKTGFSKNFFDSFFSFAYYYQVPWYKLLLQEYLKRNGLFGYENYTIECAFVYINTVNYQPVLYRMSDSLISKVLNGGEYKGKKIKGIYPLLREFIFYITESKFDFPQFYYENNFDFLLDE